MSGVSADVRWLPAVTPRGYFPRETVFISLLLQLARPLLCTKAKDPSSHCQEKLMHTLSSKLTAFVAAVAINGIVMSAVGYLFALQLQPHMTAIAFVHKVASHAWLS